MLVILHGTNIYDTYAKLHEYTNDFQGSVYTKNADEVENFEDLGLDFSQGFFAESKLVVLKRFFDAPKHILEKFEKNFDSIITDDSNIIIWQDSAISSVSKTLKLLTSKFEVYKYDVEKYPNQEKLKVISFAKDLITSWKLKIKSSEISKIIDIVGLDRYAIEHELKKLLDLQNAGIAIDDPLKYLSDSSTGIVFDLSNAIIYGMPISEFRKILDQQILIEGRIFPLIEALVLKQIEKKFQIFELKNKIVYKRLLDIDLLYKRSDLDDRMAILKLYELFNSTTQNL